MPDHSPLVPETTLCFLGTSTVVPEAGHDTASFVINGRYLVDVLSAIGSPQTALEMTTPSSPGVFRPVGTDADFTHVVMPMHLGGR